MTWYKHFLCYLTYTVIGRHWVYISGYEQGYYIVTENDHLTINYCGVIERLKLNGTFNNGFSEFIPVTFVLRGY